MYWSICSKFPAFRYFIVKDLFLSFTLLAISCLIHVCSLEGGRLVMIFFLILLILEGLFFLIEKPSKLNYVYQINPSYHIGSKFPSYVIEVILFIQISLKRFDV